MGLHAGDLVLCSGTLPATATFLERCEAASGSGCAGLSLWGRDYGAARAAGLSDADLRVMLDDHGVAIAELDGVWRWAPGTESLTVPASEDPLQFFRFEEPDLYRIAEAVGARSVNVIHTFGGDWPLEAAAEGFAAVCDRAAAHGLLAHLEFLPWTRVADLSAAWEIVRLADRSNAGLMVDSWHFFRSVPDLDALRAGPGSRLLGIQLSDAVGPPEDDLVEATLHTRRVPGAGDLDLVAFLDAVRATGTDAPIGAEVFSDELHALGPHEAARRAMAATRELIGVPA